MEAATTKQQLQLQPPLSLAPESDFVVISSASGSGSTSNGTPSPQRESPRHNQNQLQEQMLLLDRGPHAGSESEVQALARQISGVSERHSGLRRSLTGNSGSLERLRGSWTARLAEMQAELALKEAEATAKAEQCDKLQDENRLLREDFARLSTKQEEWEQTRQDYSKLKNAFDLLCNTKERLQSERDELQRCRDEAVATETEKMRAEFEANLRTATEAEAAKCQSDLATARQLLDDQLQEMKRQSETERANAESEMKAKQREAADLMQSHYETEIARLSMQLTEAIAELATVKEMCRADLRTAQTEGEKALDAERERCRAKLSDIVQQHKEAIGTMRAHYDDQIQQQEALTAEARAQLADCLGQREAEKNELLEQLKLLNVTGGGSFCGGGVVVTEAADIQVQSQQVPAAQNDDNSIERMRDRLAVQEHASSDSSRQATIGLQQRDPVLTTDASVMTELTSIDLAQAVVTARPTQSDVDRRSWETQTDQVEFQIANSASLRKDGAVRHLQIQLGAIAQSLRKEREENEAAKAEQRRLQQERDDLRDQLAAVRAAATDDDAERAAMRHQQERAVAQLTQKLTEKESELGSLLEDLDETRHKLYELQVQVKGFQCRSTDTDTQAEKLRQQIRELQTQLQTEQGQHEMELESAHREQKFKEQKLQSAESHAEHLRQEVQRLKTVEDELNRRCRENDETVQQVMTSAEEDKRRMGEERKSLESRCSAQAEALESNRQTLEQKAVVEMQLREAIEDLVARLKLKADENDQKLAEASRKQEQLYHKMCDQDDQRRKIQEQLQTTMQQLRQVTERLEESEKFSSEMQNYSASQEAEIENLKQQLQESSRKRDDLISMAEQLTGRYQDELQRSANLDSELVELRRDHARLRAEYEQVEQKVTQMFSREHEMQTQLEQGRHKLRHAEEAIDVLKGRQQVSEMEMQTLKAEYEKIRVDRDHLRTRVNSLIEELTQPHGSNSGNDLFDKHRTMRPPQGGNR